MNLISINWIIETKSMPQIANLTGNCITMLINVVRRFYFLKKQLIGIVDVDSQKIEEINMKH